MCSGCSEKVRHLDSSPNSGAGFGGQKKTAQSGVGSPLPDGAVEAYEQLRRYVVQADGQGQQLQGRGILIRHGVAAWAHRGPLVVPGAKLRPTLQGACEPPTLDSVGLELVRLLAGLILSNRQEGILHV
jgi:hypothetical protein